MATSNPFYLSVQAENDIEALFEETRNRLSLGSAEGVVLNLSIAFRRLTENAAGAENCNHISQGLYAWPVDSQMIYFRQEDDGVNILRILPAAAHIESAHTVQ